MGRRGKRNKATQRFVLADAECLAPAGRETTLLDLGDELLLNILNHLQEAPAIANVGAVNKRLNQLHFSIRGICATIETGLSVAEDFYRRTQGRNPEKRFSEAHLGAWLSAAGIKGGGFLQQLSISIDQDRETRICRRLQPAKLDWIKPISGSLQSLKLKFFLIPSEHSGKTLFKDLSSCTRLEALDLTCGRRATVTGQMLAQLLAGCKKIKKLSIAEAYSSPGDSLKLASESLEELTLFLPTGGMFNLPEVEEVSLILETPCLRRLSLRIKVGKLELRSHALRTICSECLRELSFASPLANLEMISTGEGWSFEAVEHILRSSRSHSLKGLVISDVSVPVAKLPAVLPRHLSEVKLLQIILQEISPPKLDTRVAEASWVKVGEMVAMAGKIHASEGDQYDHLFNSVVLLRGVFPSVESIQVVNFVAMDVMEAYRWNRAGKEAISRAQEDLKLKFPGVISFDPHNIAGVLAKLSGLI